MISVRPYQAAARVAMVDHWAKMNGKGAMIVLATGTGKTITALSTVVEEVLDHGGTGIWLAHRDELITQPRNALVHGWPKHGLKSGIVKGEKRNTGAQMVFASVASLWRAEDRIAALGKRDIIVVDEVHRAASASYQKVITALRQANPGAKLLGLTATPDRPDGKSLTEFFDIVYGYLVTDAIRDGWLVHPYTAVRPLNNLDLSQVSGRRDYDDAELGAALLKAEVVRSTIQALKEEHFAVRLPRRDHEQVLTARDRSTIVFTATVEQARLTALAAREEGFTAAVVSGETPSGERARILAHFTSGKIQVLFNAGVLTEGTDLPVCSCVVLARPTKSPTLFSQIIGRGLRLYDPDWQRDWGLCNANDERYSGPRECLIIDLVGATNEHSMISAPVLMSGDDCRHVWVRQKNGSGACGVPNCDAAIACFASNGPHKWDNHGICKNCNAIQCAASPTQKHVWKWDNERRKVCEFCAASYSDPMVSMHSKRRSNTVDQTAFIPILDVEPETWAVDVGKDGFIILAGERWGEGAWNVWHARPGERPRALTAQPVDRFDAWALGEDIIRRTDRVMDWRTGEARYGGKETAKARDEAHDAVRKIALKAKIIRERRAR